MGYVGFSYAEEAEGIKILEVDSGDGCVAPSKETIQDGSYKPLSRPLFMYPNLTELKKPAMKGFMDFTLENAAEDLRGVEDRADDARAGGEGQDRPDAGGVLGPTVAGADLIAGFGAPPPSGGGPDLYRRTYKTHGRRAGHQGPARRRRGAVRHHDDRHRRLAPERDRPVLRRGPDRRLPLRHRLEPDRRWRVAVLRRAAARLRHVLPDRDRAGDRDPARPRLGDLPGRVRVAARAHADQADDRAARRHPDHRARLLRADVRHAGDPARRARPGRPDLQRPRGGHRARHPGPARRSPRSPRTR